MARRRKKIIFGEENPEAQIIRDASPESSRQHETENSGKYASISSDASFRSKLGMSARTEEKPSNETVAEVVVIFDASQVIWIFDVYSAVIAFIFASALKTKFDVIAPACKFDDEQKQALAGPLAEIASKYFPQEWIKYLPEIKLAAMLAAITGGKFHAAQQVVKEIEAAKESAAKTA